MGEHIHVIGTNTSQPNVHMGLTALGNTPNLNNHMILDNHFIIDAIGSRSGLGFPHHHGVNSQYHSFYHPTLPLQMVRGPFINFHPPTATSYGVPTNPSHSATIPIHNDFEMGTRHVRASTHRQLDQPRGGGHTSQETTLGHQNLPHVGFIQVDDIALLVDHRRDIHMDSEDMSYEGLLVLGEQIGNVKPGLSEEMIASQMMTKAASVEQETDCCVICQEEYKQGEKIGILQCRHQYHADCLRKWLLQKNICPMCNSEALTPGENDV